MTRALLLVLMLGAAVGCAGVIGITDIHADTTTDGGVSIDDSGLDSHLPGDQSETSVPIESGSDAPVITGKRVFVTTALMTGTIGGVTNADKLCTTTANGVGLAGSWVAWLSTETSIASDRFSSDGPWSRLDGKVVAANRAQLMSDAILNPISLTEHGLPPTTPSFVWTGENSDSPTLPHTCSDWTSDSQGFYGDIGSFDLTTMGWKNSAFLGPVAQTCNVSAHLYCFEQ